MQTGAIKVHSLVLVVRTPSVDDEQEGAHKCNARAQAEPSLERDGFRWQLIEKEGKEKEEKRVKLTSVVNGAIKRNNRLNSRG